VGLHTKPRIALVPPGSVAEHDGTVWCSASGVSKAHVQEPVIVLPEGRLAMLPRASVVGDGRGEEDLPGVHG
jgi:hypothetical protein